MVPPIFHRPLPCRWQTLAWTWVAAGWWRPCTTCWKPTGSETKYSLMSLRQALAASSSLPPVHCSLPRSDLNAYIHFIIIL